VKSFREDLRWQQAPVGKLGDGSQGTAPCLDRLGPAGLSRAQQVGCSRPPTPAEALAWRNVLKFAVDVLFWRSSQPGQCVGQGVLVSGWALRGRACVRVALPKRVRHGRSCREAE